MCFHRRLIFSCNHSAWLGLTRACEAEGEAGTAGCGVMWSHGYDTVRVGAACAGCAARRAGQDRRLGEVKRQIRALKARLRTIRGVLEPEQADDDDGDGDGWLGLDSDSGGDGDGKDKDKGSRADDSTGTAALIASSSSSTTTTTTTTTASSASPERTDGSGDGITSSGTSLDDGCLDEVMEEVKFDPKHRPLQLPRLVAGRRGANGGRGEGEAEARRSEER